MNPTAPAGAVPTDAQARRAGVAGPSAAGRDEDGDDAAAEQHWNEAALAQAVERPVWRVWTYRAPAIVLGRSQRASLGALAAVSPLPVHPRSAGGGAVLVGPWMLGLSAALPPVHPLVRGGPVASYRWLGEALVHALHDAGVTTAQALPPEAVRGVPVEPALAWACFGGLSPWEAVVDGRKITGLAQVRRRTGVLLVAGVLLESPPWSRLCEALGRPAHEARLLGARTTAAREHAGGNAPAALRRALPARLDAALLTD